MYSLMLSIMSLSNNKGNVFTTAISLFLIFITGYPGFFRNIGKNLGMKWKKNTRFSLKANIAYKNNSLWTTDYPVSFLAVLRKLRSELMNSQKPINYDVKQFPNYQKRDTIMFVELLSPFMITDGIFISTKMTTSQSEKGDYDYTNLEITLSTQRCNNFKIIESFVDCCVEEYDEEMANIVKTQHTFIFDTYDKECRMPRYQEHPFDTTKSFENMFFDEKQKVLNRINYFLNNKAEYHRLGIPYTLGILLYGLPGTSKTSFIKSLAKHTKRHIVVLPTKKIKSIDTLKTVFLEEMINGIKIPNDKRLYVFEDIDCGSWKDVVMSRTMKKDHKPDVQLSMEKLSMLLDMKGSVTDEQKKTILEDTSITLGDFLEILDGVVEMPGRMLIMTSNHPDVLDPALIRPGRIDIVMECKRMSRKNVADMYKLWFGCSIPDKVYQAMSDHVFTLAEIGAMFAQHRLDTEELHKCIVGSGLKR